MDRKSVRLVRMAGYFVLGVAIGTSGMSTWLGRSEPSAEAQSLSDCPQLDQELLRRSVGLPAPEESFEHEVAVDPETYRNPVTGLIEVYFPDPNPIEKDLGLSNTVYYIDPDLPACQASPGISALIRMTELADRANLEIVCAEMRKPPSSEGDDRGHPVDETAVQDFLNESCGGT